jgi:hypothetical protein
MIGRMLVDVSWLADMLNRLNRVQRWRAALLLALTYVLTVLSPSIANAFAPEPLRVAHHHGIRASMPGSEVAHHVHSHGDEHDDQHHQQGDESKSLSIDLQCCGLACVGALPAPLVGVCAPTSLLGIRLSLAADIAAGQAPPEHYRPPIV